MVKELCSLGIPVPSNACNEIKYFQKIPFLFLPTACASTNVSTYRAALFVPIFVNACASAGDASFGVASIDAHGYGPISGQGDSSNAGATFNVSDLSAISYKWILEAQRLALRFCIFIHSRFGNSFDTWARYHANVCSLVILH